MLLYLKRIFRIISLNRWYPFFFLLALFLIYLSHSADKHLKPTLSKNRIVENESKKEIPNFNLEENEHRKKRDDQKLINKLKNIKKNSKINTTPAIKIPNECDWFKELNNQKSDIEISELIKTLPFDNPDGGIWKQGFEIEYNTNQWNKDNKLNIILMPHSHNDPGWLNTFQEYFNSATRGIIDTIVETLIQKQDRKFIWAEMSYLQLWWNQASDDMKSKMKKLILETKQLEIVTGGWVMADEANTYYYAVIDQLIEGHEWLKNNIDPTFRPVHAYANDPFGYSSTMPYILTEMGFDSMMIQRVHYHLKKYLARENKLEFYWKQFWSKESILTHLTPFVLYDVPNTCGPDPKVCCQFDFIRLSQGVNCNSGLNPQAITDSNLDERAKLLLDQYRKKSQLYGNKNHHNLVLIPVGDDFMYRNMRDSLSQFENYEKLMKYLNEKEEFNVNIQWGTLKDYFDKLRENNEKYEIGISSFSGDFFTYADREDHYWSGYFTTRQFYKRLDRLAEGYLRTAEIFYSLNNLFGKDIGGKMSELYKELLVARRNLGLFQHHDGITGTARTYVVKDYTDKLYLALKNSKNVIEYSTSQLLNEQNSQDIIFKIEDVRLEQNSNNNDNLIKLTKEKNSQKIILINSNLNKRNEIITLRVNDPNVQVIKSDGTIFQNIQLSLVWSNTDGGILTDFKNDQNFDQSQYELIFPVDLDPISLTSFTIQLAQEANYLQPVQFYANDLNKLKNFKEITNISIISINFTQINNNSEFIRIKSAQDSEAFFSTKTGLLEKISTKSKDYKTNIKLVKYGTRKSNERSGAYLFLPDGNAVEIDAEYFEWIRVEYNGKLRNRVCVQMTIILHCVEFYPELNDLKKFQIPHFSVWNVVDLRPTYNFELALEIETDIKNNDEIHTDLNGFQFTKRKRYDKLTLQGNVFPMPSGAFIQDSNLRLNLITAQPVGVGTLNPGAIQVFLDRKLEQDDSRGLQQAVNDNVLVSNRFVLFYELIKESKELEKSLEYPSVIFNLMSHDLLSPIVKMLSLSDSIKSSRNFVSQKQHCNLRLFNLRTLGGANEVPLKQEVGLILHRVPYHNCHDDYSIDIGDYYKNECDSKKDLSFQDLFIEAKNFQIKKTYLSLRERENDLDLVKKEDFVFNLVKPMEIKAFRVKFN
ncbi:unnamed protein product [Brachionus calyciflorus]|uniref:Alpha-mannosidase n=1 Tax=Brachionus calyciflorus TaxID=104777 RepID=A0A813W2T7_9BILA|nr:unnamed protein product [Brachionus calyciflorus]